MIMRQAREHKRIAIECWRMVDVGDMLRDLNSRVSSEAKR